MDKYRKRIADDILDLKLKSFGATLIVGPKGCGKTTTAKQKAKSVIEFQDEDLRERYLSVAETMPSKLLIGETPRLFDEWQDAPKIWGAIRKSIDDKNESGLYILTGSSSQDVKTPHTGTTRISTLKMYPMSLYESGESNGKISLLELFNTKELDFVESNLSIDGLIFSICRGGWPWATLVPEGVALDQAFDYFDSVVNYDIQRVDKVKRSAERTKLLLRSYARNIAQQVSMATIRKDMLANDSSTLDENTVVDYIKALKKLYVIEDLPAWNPNIRSKAAIRTSDTRHFVDPSVGTAALGLGPKDLINDLQSFGLLFEDLVVRDLRVYAETLDGSLYHYRDSNGLECDAVLHRRNGSYALLEVKLGGEERIEEGAKNLKDLESKIDTERMLAPSFLAVVVGVGQYAYQRKDGVYVLPISCLKD